MSIGSESNELDFTYEKELISKNSLSFVYPNIAEEWHPTKNGDLLPINVTYGSKKVVWWLGKCGHEWDMSILSRTNRNSGCPYCSVPAKRVLSGFNDLKTKFPQIAEEWHPTKNGDLLPIDITFGSKKVVWWLGKCGHEWDMSILSRTSMKCGCPYCSVPAKRVLSGFNDLKTKFPQIAEEWHPSKNGNISPDNILPGSKIKVWWLGKCGHEWEQSIQHRVNTAKGCPFCTHQKVLEGVNDLASVNPELLQEWDYKMNDISPKKIMAGSPKKAWWICPFGHSYQSSISGRSKMHLGCPVCAKESRTSFPEQAMFYYIKKYYQDAINSDMEAIGLELDIFIPSLKVAIEYDGIKWHKTSKTDNKKNLLCIKKNIRLIRIREEGLCVFDNCLCLVRSNLSTNESLSNVIQEVLYILNEKGEKADIDVDRDAMQIYSTYILSKKKQSFGVKYPIIAEEWHPYKNNSITPEMVYSRTNKKVWWLGKCGHEWQASIASRTGEGVGCPICSNHSIIKGVNDLLSRHPIICEEWNYKKNDINKIFPDEIAYHSGKRVWWTCKQCGFEWECPVVSRTGVKKSGCPKCANHKRGQRLNRSIRNIDTNDFYKSIKEAEEKTGIHRNSISMCCLNKIKTAGGFRWEYISK